MASQIKKNTLYYFIEKFDKHYLTKNIGIFAKYLSNDFNIEFISLKITSDLKGVPYVVTKIPFIKLLNNQIYFPWKVLIKTKRNDVLWAYPGHFGAFVAMVISRIKGSILLLKSDSFPLFKNIRNPQNLQNKISNYLLYRLPIRASNIIIAETKSTRDFLTQRWHIAEEKIVMVPNGIILSEYKKIDKSLGNIQRNKSILYLARITKTKGFDLFIEAIKKFKDEYRIDVAGPVEEPEIFNKYKNVFDHPTINYHGPLYEKDLFRMLKRSYIFVNSSRSEGYNNTIPKALFFGCKVVATNVGETRDILKDGEFGILCKPEKDHLEAAIEKCIDWDPDWKGIRKYLSNELNWEKNIIPLKRSIKNCMK
ncbi:glycosyltransferase [Candidatus Dojkabacteria bacterium]|nr:glycosyltransferase [Candidatus Dojkabacteria bacterium]